MSKLLSWFVVINFIGFLFSILLAPLFLGLFCSYWFFLLFIPAFGINAAIATTVVGISKVD